MATRICIPKQRTKADRYEARNYLTNLLFEGQIKRACDEALKMWERGTITEEDYRFVQTRRDLPGMGFNSEAEISFHRRLVE